MASGEWPPDLDGHVAGCEACRQMRAVLGFMGRLAAGDPGTPVPAAGVVFLRARTLDRLRRESEALEAAGRPLRLAGAAAGAVALGALALAGGWLSGQAPAPLVPWVSSLQLALLAAAAIAVVRSWGQDGG